MLGLLSLIVPLVPVPLALLFGWIALRRRCGAALRGRARTGVALGVLGAVIWVGAMALMLPEFLEARRNSAVLACQANLRQVGQFLRLYAYDHRGATPPDLATFARAVDLPPDLLVCPEADGRQLRSGPDSSYVYLQPDAGASLDGTTVLMCERTGHHGGRANALLSNEDVVLISEADARTIAGARVTTP